MTLQELLQEVLDDQRYAEYVGGTLAVTVDGRIHLFNVGDYHAAVSGGPGRAEEQISLSAEERRLVAALYVKHKQPSHKFYEAAQYILAE